MYFHRLGHFRPRYLLHCHYLPSHFDHLLLAYLPQCLHHLSPLQWPRQYSPNLSNLLNSLALTHLNLLQYYLGYRLSHLQRLSHLLDLLQADLFQAQ